jgi:hypothetical protein
LKKIGITLLILVVLHIPPFHLVRGSMILPTDEAVLQRSISALVVNNSLVKSQLDLERLGIIAQHVVSNDGTKTGEFRVLFLNQLDGLEKFHHLVHQPFTGYNRLFTDIWINSLTVYGTAESTWGVNSPTVIPADQLGILLLLVDRLQRGYGEAFEHVQCYVEIFTGMSFYTVSGRATVYRRVLKLAKSNPTFRTWLRHRLVNRSSTYIDDVELRFWNLLAADPSVETLNRLAENNIPANSSISNSMSQVQVLDGLLR